MKKKSTATSQSVSEDGPLFAAVRNQRSPTIATMWSSTRSRSPMTRASWDRCVTLPPHSSLLRLRAYDVAGDPPPPQRDAASVWSDRCERG